MTFINELTTICDKAIQSLEATHDFYTHTKSAWRLLQQMVKQGRDISSKTIATGEIVSGKELSQLAQGYVTGYLAQATLSELVSSFEHFLIRFLTVWLKKHPGNLSKETVSVKEIQDFPDIISYIAERKLNNLAYARVSEWFKYFEQVTKLNYPSEDQIKRISEVKASRDIFIHNQGVVNERYINKANELARFQNGERLDLPDNYLLASFTLLKNVVDGVRDATIEKLQREQS